MSRVDTRSDYKERSVSSYMLLDSCSVLTFVQRIQRVCLLETSDIKHVEAIISRKWNDQHFRVWIVQPEKFCSQQAQAVRDAGLVYAKHDWQEHHFRVLR